MSMSKGKIFGAFVGILLVAVASMSHAAEVAFSEDFAAASAIDVTAAAGTSISTTAYDYDVTVAAGANKAQVDVTGGELVTAGEAGYAPVWMRTDLDAPIDLAAVPVTVKIDRKATAANSQWACVYLIDADDNAIKVVANVTGNRLIVRASSMGDTGGTEGATIDFAGAPLVTDTWYTWTIKFTAPDSI